MNLNPSHHLSLLLLLVINLKGAYGSRIIGGDVVSPYTIKYQASLRFFSSHFCGGILVHPQWVMSAAHCWRPTYFIQVYLGDHDITKWEGYEQVFNVIFIIRHGQYNYLTFDNDIMLLKLHKPAEINSWVDTVTLPDLNLVPLDQDTVCTVSGWGVISLNYYQLSPVLRAVDVNIFPNCWYFYYFRITQNMICAGSQNGGKDSCQGDSGGPLICNGKLEGIVSWGIGCAYAYYPGVYTKVQNYLSWINFIIQNR
ncbi:trypsin-3 [Cynoglossus semilaevis]|uniref:trypsin n=1 Tax=Cynoglossus semilaevis TaxID=244447 RepID=A0A3P8V1N6_CYNSE|nr:trypsin-3-like [Cynoglossus semilaevis]